MPDPKPIREPVRLTVTISEEAAQALRRLAEREGVTISDLVANALRAEFDVPKEATDA